MTIQFDRARWTQDSEGFWLCLRVKIPAIVRQFVETMKSKLYDADIKIHREKRSIDANAFAWELITKLANALTAEAQGDTAYSKDDVYLMMLKRYGQGGIVKVPNGDIEKFKRAWKYCEVHETLWGENAVYYRFWVGSSNYDTKEMSLFIDGIVSECKLLDIPTETPDEIAKMEALWEEK